MGSSAFVTVRFDYESFRTTISAHTELYWAAMQFTCPKLFRSKHHHKTTTTKTPKTPPQEHQKHHHKNTKRNNHKNNLRTITPLFSTMACKLATEFLCLYRELSTCEALKKNLCNYKDWPYYVQAPSKPRTWMHEWHMFYHHLVVILGSHMRFPCSIMSHHVPSTVL